MPSVENTATPTRRRLASYMAMSALLSSSVAVAPWSGCTATPMLQPTWAVRPSRSTGRRTSSRMRSASSSAAVRELWASRTANSSPPRRATVVVASAAARCTRRPILVSRVSPRWWPSPSLMYLNPSRSSSSSTTRPFCGAVPRGQRRAEPVEEMGPVGQPGQRVVHRPERAVAGLPLGPPLVAEQDQGAAGQQEPVQDGDHRRHHPGGPAEALEVEQVAVELGALLRGPGHRLLAQGGRAQRRLLRVEPGSPRVAAGRGRP